jgi:hypothetical protein
LIPFSFLKYNHLFSLLPHPLLLLSVRPIVIPSHYTCKGGSLYFLWTRAITLQLIARCSLSMTEIYYHLYANNLISRKFKLSLRRTSVSVSVLFKWLQNTYHFNYVLLITSMYNWET